MIKILILLILSACSTGYKEKGFSGGYSEFKISDNSYRVTFEGNGYTKNEDVQKMLLKRCAELTLKEHFKYFVLGNGDTESSLQLLDTNTEMNFVSAHTIAVIMKMTNSPDKRKIFYDAQLVLKQ